MFIGVFPYKSIGSFVAHERILALDTTDMSLEYVATSDILEYNIPISMSQMYQRYGKIAYSRDALMNYGREAKKTDVIRVLPDDTILLDKKTKLKMTRPGTFSTSMPLVINGVELFMCRFADIQYVFRYRDLYIARIFTRKYNEEHDMWMSAAISKLGEVNAIWGAGKEYNLNAGVGVQVDTLMEY